jgi:uncharacterized membrane protein
VDFLSDTGMWLRWVHLFAGIIWIGLLWFYNFMNGPFTNALEPEVRSKVIPQLMPRTLWWFRWGAAVTWLTGVLYGFMVLPKVSGGHSEFFNSTRGWWISMAFVYGSVMAFNVWFMIWPRQQKIIRATIKGENPPEKAAWAKTATNCSRVNTYLSIGLLFAMGAAKHRGETGGNLPVGFNGWLVEAVAVSLIGFAVAWTCIHKVGPAVGKNFQA